MAKEVDNLSVQKQLSKLFDQRLNTETRILGVMQQELQVALQLQSVMNGLSNDDLIERLQAGTDAMKELSKEAEETGDIGAKAMKQIATSSNAAHKSVSVVGSVFTGLASTMKTAITTAGGFAKSAFHIGKALLSIPMGIFKGLMNDAAQAAGDTSFMQALEDIRKEFGTFKDGTSKDILGAYSTLNTQLQQVSGLSVWKVFENPAGQLKYLHDIASKAGSQILQFGDELSKSSGIIATFDKGMGIGSENMKAMMNRATVFGTSLTKQLGDVANYALQLGKDFGISSKIISREVGTMMKDVRNFGSLTQKEMTVAAVYTKKLGLEIKDLTGLVDKFDNFDKAAESSAQLSQAFGATVDAFKLMNEQDPAKRLDELRKSMTATGKSTENMTRQELHLLAQTSGLSDEAAKLAFSTKNQGLSYDQVQKQANKAETAQMKQADALKKLADNIERVVRSGGQLEGSFFKMFMNGMEQGVKWSNSYRHAMMNVRKALMDTFWAGRQVGKELGDNDAFGFARFMKGFGTTFGPTNVNKILHGFTKEVTENGVKVKKSFGGVVGELTSVIKGGQGIGDAVKHIRAQFHEVVGPDTFKDMIEGGKTLMRSVAKGIGSGLSFITQELTHVLTDIAEFMTNPDEFMKKAESAGAGPKNFGVEIIKTIAKAFDDKDGKKLNALADAFVNFIVGIGSILKRVSKNPRVEKALNTVGFTLISMMLSKTLLGMIPSLMSSFGPMLAKALTTSAGSVVAGAGAAALVGVALVNVNEKIKKFEDGMDKHLDPASKKAGAFGASFLQGLTFGLVPDNIAIIIGNKIAKLAEVIYDSIQKSMGAPFVNKLKSVMGSGIDLFSSVGGLLGAIIGGDDAAIKANAAVVGVNFVKFLGTALDFLVTEFPKLLMKVQGIVDTVVGSIVVSFGEGLVKLGDKMGILGQGFKGAGILIMGFGNILQKLGDNIAFVSNKVKEFDLSKTISDQMNKIHQSLLKTGISILDNVPGPVLALMGFSGAKTEKNKNALRDTIRKNLDELEASILASNKLAAESKKQFEERQNPAAAVAKQEITPPTGSLTPGPTVSATQVDVQALMSQKKTLEENLKGLEEFAQKGVVKNISEMIPQASTALSSFNEKLASSNIGNTVNVTQGVVKSINELNAILAEGDAGAIKVGAKLQRFANNSGLGKSGTYEIKNKGITLKLDLKIVMDAGEVEKAIVLRKDSILFDVIDDLAGVTLDDKHREQLRAFKGGS